MTPPQIVQAGDHVHFVEVVKDTPAVTVYRVRAGKWPKVRMLDRAIDYPVPTPDTPEYHRWPHGAATLAVDIGEDNEERQSARVLFFDDATGGEWLIQTCKRGVWVVLLKDAPPRFTGFE